MEIKNIKKIDLASEIARGTGLNLTDAAEIVDLFFNILSDGIAENKEVKIMGLGTFTVKHKNARVGRNPKTGEDAVIEERNVISFRPAKNLKTTLN
ncbi:MAG: integration host factor subunit alpha [bacterium]|nr:integration host factor subunit alpha [bacterium]